ncbi:hypothetical protein [Azospirillum thiophilum]|nr:hypothetical protein [Azospirillum thiophilum]
MERSGSEKRKLAAAVTVRLSDELATAVVAEAKAAKVRTYVASATMTGG